MALLKYEVARKKEIYGNNIGPCPPIPTCESSISLVDKFDHMVMRPPSLMLLFPIETLIPTKPVPIILSEQNIF